MSSGKKWAFRLRHILESIEKIGRYTAGLTEDEFKANSLVIDGVVRNFQIIGEAARKVPSDVKAAHPELPWRDMERMRHVLVHDYDRVRTEVVWRTIQKHLPPLVEPLERLLEESGEEE